MLGDLAALAAEVEREERQILAAALGRLKVAEDEEERRVLEEVVERARGRLGENLIDPQGSNKGAISLEKQKANPGGLT